MNTYKVGVYCILNFHLQNLLELFISTAFNITQSTVLWLRGNANENQERRRRKSTARLRVNPSQCDADEHFPAAWGQA